jgi:hypothetical protein
LGHRWEFPKSRDFGYQALGNNEGAKHYKLIAVSRAKKPVSVETVPDMAAGPTVEASAETQGADARHRLAGRRGEPAAHQPQ